MNAEADEPLPPPSDDLAAITAERKKRQMRMLGGGAVLVALLGGGAFAMNAQQERKADERISHAFGALSRCLLGAPLEAGETPGNRLRRVQLTAMAMTDKQRTPEGGQSWPEGCGTFAFQLDEALRDAGRSKGDKDLAHAAAALGKLLKEPTSFSADLNAPTDALWSLAPLENVQPAPAVEVAAPPGRAEPMDADGLGRGTPLAQKAFSFKAVYTEPHPALDLRVLIDEQGAPGSPFLCTVRRATPGARCVALPAAISATKQGLRLLGTADDGAAPADLRRQPRERGSLPRRQRRAGGALLRLRRLLGERRLLGRARLAGEGARARRLAQAARRHHDAGQDRPPRSAPATPTTARRCSGTG